MRIAWVLIIAVLLCAVLQSCTSVNKKARQQADYIMEHLDNYDLIQYKLNTDFFPPEETQDFVGGIKNHCDWPNRQGKYVDFFKVKNVGAVDQTYFIYEYFLRCDSLRFVLMYNLKEQGPELFKINIEPLEVVNEYIVDPSRQLMPK